MAVKDDANLGGADLGGANLCIASDQTTERTSIMTQQRSIATIAREIRHNWRNPYFGAVPYLTAMLSLDSTYDNYGQDSGRSIIAYFLSNATTWRGETARRIKIELNTILKAEGYPI